MTEITSVTTLNYTILWSTQGGRAKACARRTARILRDTTSELFSNDHGYGDGGSELGMGYYGSSFDDYGASDLLELGRSSDSLGGTKKLVILFVSTTGDGEHCDSIRDTWRALLQKSLPNTTFQNLNFALFCLGDRAYGPQAFCAAGRKLAARLVQLGATPYCRVGYGDDGTSNGGVFRDLDTWLDEDFLLHFLDGKKGGVTCNSKVSGRGIKKERVVGKGSHGGGGLVPTPQSPYQVTFIGESVKSPRIASKTSHSSLESQHEWQKQPYWESYASFFRSQCPATAYRYDPNYGTRLIDDGTTNDRTCDVPLLGYVTSNTRISDPDWKQDTRHIAIHVRTTRAPSDRVASKKYETTKQTLCRRTADTNAPEAMTTSDQPPPLSTAPLPYEAGDIATILPSNPKSAVDRFLANLPSTIRLNADKPINIDTLIASSTQYASSFTQWPRRATLRGLLTHCADIMAFPEREDLRSLSVYCNLKHPMGRDQRDKLVSLSETEDAALYGDYVIREKRDWAAVLFDFDSIRFEGVSEGETLNNDNNDCCLLTIEQLLLLLPPIMPRHFSIASAPSTAIVHGHERGYIRRDVGHPVVGFDLELCVAVVEGQTRHKRKYLGLCSNYLARLKPGRKKYGRESYDVRVWIRPGSFGRLPRKIITCGGGAGREEGKNGSTRYRFETPVMCIGAGTGVAPLRSLIHEREAILALEAQTTDEDPLLMDASQVISTVPVDYKPSNILVFGCRKSTADYYYRSEWEPLVISNHLRLLTAFSQDQKHKIYVQRIAREADDGYLIAKHVVEDGGAVYIAGGAKMARAVREEMVECLSKILPGGERDGKALLKRLQNMGKFSVEAWS